MLRKLFYFVILIGITSIFDYESEKNTVAFGDAPPSFEEKFAEVGYQSVEDAIKKFENHCKCEVKLPQGMPSIKFTHKFGRFFEDSRYNINHSLTIMFVDKEERNNVYKIDIRPLKNKLQLEGEKYTLQDGSTAIYFEHDIFNFFVFEKGNLQYILGINKNVSATATPQILIEIANSFK
ncbi:hypothetical protein HNO89_003296 [Sporosarcina luteola]|nr:hypothetical protein [Sporosarcina luteola]